MLPCLACSTLTRADRGGAVQKCRIGGSPKRGGCFEEIQPLWSIPVAFNGGWFCLRFPHVGRRGWIHEAFQRVRSNRCVIPAAHQVRRTHRDATHITHHSVRSPPAGGGIFFRSPRLNVVRVPRGLGVFIKFVYYACYAHSGSMCMTCATCASLSCV